MTPPDLKVYTLEELVNMLSLSTEYHKELYEHYKNASGETKEQLKEDITRATGVLLSKLEHTAEVMGIKALSNC